MKIGKTGEILKILKVIALLMTLSIFLGCIGQSKIDDNDKGLNITLCWLNIGAKYD